jgi:putative transposase
VYYAPQGESAENLELMRQIDQLYTKWPFYGSRRMVAHLRTQGHKVNRKRIQRLMGVMGIETVYVRPRTSKPAPEHKVYPYLLRNLSIVRPNQVWCSDITYIRLARGFAYLVAVMDWYSRYVLTWRLSNSLATSFCLEALQEALERFGRPEIFNSDQGGQYTSTDFTDCLKAVGVDISMDGRGRVFDNIFIERLWRSLKYEEVYLNDYDSMPRAVRGLGSYFRFYDDERLHQSLGYVTPASVYLN